MASLSGTPVQAGPAPTGKAAVADPAKTARGKRGSPTTVSEANDLLSRGTAALAAGNLAEATQLLSDSYRRSPRPEVLFQLGKLALAEGRTLAAQDLFRRYLNDPAREPNEETVKLAEAELEKPLSASGTVAVSSDPGALVQVDGKIVGTLPLPLPLLLSPGPHTVTLELPHRRLESPVQVLAGRASELRLSGSSGTTVVSVLPAILYYPPAPTDAHALTGEAKRLFADALEHAARGEQYTLLAVEVALPQAPDLKSCLGSLRCQLELAAKNSVEFILTQRPTAAGMTNGSSFASELQLLRVGIPEPAATATVSCTSCTPEQLAARTKEAAGKLFGEGLLRQHGTLRVSVEPAEASLRIGERAEAKAPFTGEMWAGSYPVSVRLNGYKPQQDSVEIRDGQPTELSVKLQPVENPGQNLPIGPTLIEGTERAKRPAWRLALGGTAIGVGLGLAVLGGLGVAKDDTCPSSTMAGIECAMVFDTKTIGGAAIGTGAALTIAGVVMLALPGPRRKTTTVATGLAR